jgi:hypothetical protein
MQMISYEPQTKVLVNFLRQEPRIVGLTNDEDGIQLWVVADIEGTVGLVFCQGKTECMAINKVKAIRHLLVEPDAEDLNDYDDALEATSEDEDHFRWMDPEEAELQQAMAA